jgi:hypothetical protein
MGSGNVSSGPTTMDKTGGTSSGRIDGTTTPGSAMEGDAEIHAEDRQVDQRIKSICKGC